MFCGKKMAENMTGILTREFLDSDSLLRQYTSHVFRHFLAAKH